MKNFLLLSATVLALSASAQDEWNGTPNSVVPMTRDGFVGIGTAGAMPNVPLVVQDPNPANGAHVTFGTNGILGSYGPQATVLQLTSPNFPDAVFHCMHAGSGPNRSELIFGIGPFGAGIYSGKGPSGVTQPIQFYTNGSTGMTEKMRIEVDGKVSIGTLAGGMPGTYKLYVQEGILTEKVKVAIDGTANWADYVFASDYKLQPIEEVAAFIKKNKHLPGVPSATEMVEKGLDVATMDAKLLEKLEEMMLYIIELKQEVEQLKQENQSFKSSE